MSEDLVRMLEAEVAKERACALSVVAALRELAAMLEQRLTGDALDAAAEACATVAAKHAKRGTQIGSLASGLGAMIAGQNERRAMGLHTPASAPAARAGNGSRPPAGAHDEATTDEHAGESRTPAPSGSA